MSHGWAGLNIIETDDFPASIVYREPSKKEKISIGCQFLVDARSQRKTVRLL